MTRDAVPWAELSTLRSYLLIHEVVDHCMLGCVQDADDSCVKFRDSKEMLGLLSMFQQREWRQLQGIFEDLRAWIDWAGFAVRIQLRDQRISVRVETGNWGCLGCGDVPAVIRILRSDAVAAGASGEGGNTPSSVRCLMWFSTAGSSLPRTLLSSVRIEAGGLALSPAAEWAWLLCHLCGSDVLSRQSLEVNDFVLMQSIEASVRVCKLLKLASDHSYDTYGVSLRDNNEFTEAGRSGTGRRRVGKYDEFLADAVSLYK